MIITRQIYYFIKLTITPILLVICIIAFVMMNIVITAFHL